MGREEFEIKSQIDGGYSASGHTQLKLPGAMVDLHTTLTVDKTGQPVASTAKGSTQGSPFEQSVVVKNDTAAITTNGNVQELPFKKGAALLGGNISYFFQFVLARYDAARAGSQQIPIFPGLSAKIERAGHDEIQPTAAGAKRQSFDRYSLSIAGSNLVVWVDDRGRLAIITVPAQNFAAVREEYTGLIESFKAELAAKHKAPVIDYSAPPGATFTAEEVTVAAKGFTLAGTLLIPKTGKAPFPAVITITGSGQQTRDESLPLPGLENYKPFRQIAETLASRGIAVIRVDDRGVGKSKGFDTLGTATSSSFADDVRAQVSYLRSRSAIDSSRIALLGHSEGGIIAPMVAVTDPGIAAIVLMAATAKRGDEVLLYQFKASIDANQTLSEEEKAKRLEEQKGGIRKAIETGDTSGLPPALRGADAWVKEFLTYDPLPMIRKVGQPVLILQGALDRQVTADQAAMLERAAREAGNNDVTARTYPALNHLFLRAKTGAVSEYTSLSTNSIPQEVLDLLSEWLVQKLKVSR